MRLIAIAAMARNRVIGSDGHLPWNLPEDMDFFRRTTLGHILIMGRKTFTSFSKPLPKRHHIVVSESLEPSYQGINVARNKAHALDLAHNATAQWPQDIYIIGGAQIYQLFLAETQRVLLTEIHTDFPGDTVFPPLGEAFQETQRIHRPGPPAFDFVTYDRAP